MKSWSKKSVPDNAPPTALEPTTRPAAFEANSMPVADRNRFFVLAVILAVALAAAGLALARLEPLKTAVPYIVHVHGDGSVTVSDAAAQKYTPGHEEIQYFVAQWVQNMMTLDASLTKQNLSTAFLRTRGQAVSEFKAFIHQRKPIARVENAPDLTRNVQVLGISFVQKGIVLVRFQTVRQSDQSAAPVTKIWQMTVNFKIIPPTTERQILSNPIGLFITHFDLEQEVS